MTMKRRDLLAGAAALAGGSLCSPGARAAGMLTTQLEDGTLWVRDEGRPVLAYRHAPVSGPAGTGPLYARSAYIHPVHAPCGAVVTDDFPKDHPHQRGVFFAWTKTRVPSDRGDLHPDFWNLGSGLGRVLSRKVSGKNVAGEAQRFRAEHLWEMRRGESWEEALREIWEVVVHPPAFTDPQAPGAAYVFDLITRQTPSVTIELPRYRYGGMCVRGAREWVGKDSGLVYLTSEGRDWSSAEGTPARWVDQSGPVEGRVCGVTLMEHPRNLRAPNLLRIPPGYPYAVYCPSKGADLTLEAGREYVFRYRIVAHNGPARPEALNALWSDFART